MNVDGAPLADAHLACDFECVDDFMDQYGHSAALGTITDANGRFSLEFERLCGSGFLPSLMLTFIEDGESRLVGGKELARNNPSRTWDVGDVTLSAILPIAAGVVVDDQGNPLDGAYLEVAQFGRLLGCRTNERGEFSLFSAMPGGTVSLNVHRDGLDSRWQVVGDPGKTDWRIVLTRTGAVVAGFSINPLWNPEDIQIDLIRADVRDGFRDSRESPPEGLWANPARWTCSAGNYVLTARLAIRKAASSLLLEREHWVELVRIDGIEVKPGAATDMGRIELVSSAKILTLPVIAPDGGTLRECVFAHGPESSDLTSTLWRSHPLPIFKSALVIAPLHESVDVAIRAHGMKLKVFKHVRDGQVLQMEPGYPVTIRIANPIGRAPVDTKFMMGLRSAHLENRYHVDDHEFAIVGTDNEASVVTSIPGRFRVRWYLKRAARGMGSTIQLFDEPEQYIEIADTQGLQRIEVDCPIDPATAWRN